MLLEPVEPRLPLSLLLGDPTAQLLHALDVQPARTPLTVDPLVDQPATPEDADVTGDGLMRQVERLGKLTHGRLASGKPGDDRSTGPITERGKGRVHVGIDVRSSWHDSTVSATKPLYNYLLEHCGGSREVGNRSAR